MNSFCGTGVALITPFKADKTIDYNALKKLVNYQIDNKVDYLVVLGTTAEPATLTFEEKEKIKTTIIKINNGRLPLVLGIGGNHTNAVVNEIQQTNLDAFDAILSVAPYYNKPTQEGLYQHFKAIAEVSSKPILLYNVPNRTAVNICPKTVIRLATDFSNIIGIKDATGNIAQVLHLLQNKPTDFLVISGDDMMALPITLTGGNGVISVLGQGLPKDFSKMIELAIKNDAKKASSLHYKLMNGINYIFEEGNPTGIKALLKKIAICEPYVRLPLVEASPQLQKRIDTFIDNY